MSVETKINGANQAGRLHLIGTFDFRMRDEFKDAYTPLLEDNALQHIEVDMQQVDYIDSTALGMLLILKDAAEAYEKDISIFNAQGATAHVLRSSKFGQIIDMRKD